MGLKESDRKALAIRGFRGIKLPAVLSSTLLDAACALLGGVKCSQLLLRCVYIYIHIHDKNTNA